MDLTDAGNAGKGLAAVISSITALRESLRRPNGPDPKFVRSEDFLRVLDVLVELTELLGQQNQALIQAVRLIDDIDTTARRGDGTAAVLAGVLRSDLTKKQRRRLKKARKTRGRDSDQ